MSSYRHRKKGPIADNNRLVTHRRPLAMEMVLRSVIRVKTCGNRSTDRRAGPGEFLVIHRWDL